MFEMKYDKDGQPIKNENTKKVLEQQAAAVQQQEELQPQLELSSGVDNTPQPQVPEQEEHAEQQASPQRQESSKDRNENLRILRERAERVEYERDEAIRIIKELQAKQYQAQQQSTPVQEESDDLGINPDDLVEGKHIDKVAKKIKKLEDQLKVYQQKTTESAMEMRLKSQYPDFDKVVSIDNLKALSAAHPEIAETIKNSNNMYNQAVSAYTMIKKLGVYSEDTYQQDRERALKNAAKPRPLASVSPQQGESPLARANAFSAGLTEELKSQLRKEMSEARKNL